MISGGPKPPAAIVDWRDRPITPRRRRHKRGRAPSRERPPEFYSRRLADRRRRRRRPIRNRHRHSESHSCADLPPGSERRQGALRHTVPTNRPPPDLIRNAAHRD